MQDFKPRRTRSRKRSATRRPRQGGLAPGATLGLAAAPAGAQGTTNKRAPGEVDWRESASATGSVLHKLAFAVALGWLVVGLARGGAELWRSPLAHVDVVGNRTLDALEVVEAAGLQAGMALGGVDPYAVALRLVALPRVKGADVRRRFPGRVDIALTERVAVAVLATEGEPPQLVDEAGVLLGASRAGDPGQEALPRLRFATAPPPERVAWGLATARTVQRLGVARGGAFALELENPFAPVLRLPERRQRIVLPPQAPEAALRTLLGLPLPAHPGGWQTLDFRTMGEESGARIIITG